MGAYLLKQPRGKDEVIMGRELSGLHMIYDYNRHVYIALLCHRTVK